MNRPKTAQSLEQDSAHIHGSAADMQSMHKEAAIASHTAGEEDGEDVRESQVYYITKYALTKGLIIARGQLCESRRGDGTLMDDFGGRMISVQWAPSDSGYGGCTTVHKPGWYTSREEADARIAAMRAAKVKALKAQVEQLERPIKVDDRTALV